MWYAGAALEAAFLLVEPNRQERRHRFPVHQVRDNEGSRSDPGVEVLSRFQQLNKSRTSKMQIRGALNNCLLFTNSGVTHYGPPTPGSKHDCHPGKEDDGSDGRAVCYRS